MVTYISLLRGINVSGQKKIRMEELRDLYEELGFKHVRSYIQSGNVIFTTEETDEVRIAGQVSKAISGYFQFEVPVILRRLEDMKRVIASNPYTGLDGINEERLYVTFFEAVIHENEMASLQGDYSPERCVIINREAYLYCPMGAGKAKLNNNFLENKLKMKATTRNWRTVNILAEMAAE